MPSYQYHDKITYTIPRYQVTIQLMHHADRVLSFQTIASLRSSLCESLFDYGCSHIYAIDIRTYGSDSKGIFYILSSDCTTQSVVSAIESLKVTMLTSPTETNYVTSEGVRKMTDRLRM